MDNHDKIAKLLRMSSAEVAMCKMIISRNLIDGKKEYKNGIDDTIIARLAGVREIDVKTIRWHYFGDSLHDRHSKGADATKESKQIFLDYCEEIRAKLLDQSEATQNAADELGAIATNFIYSLKEASETSGDDEDGPAEARESVLEAVAEIQNLIASIFDLHEDFCALVDRFKEENWES